MKEDDEISSMKTGLHDALEQPDAVKLLNEVGLDAGRAESLLNSMCSDDCGELAVTEFFEAVHNTRGEAKATDIPEEQDQTASPPWQIFWKQKKDKKKKMKSVKGHSPRPPEPPSRRSGTNTSTNTSTGNDGHGGFPVGTCRRPPEALSSTSA